MNTDKLKKLWLESLKAYMAADNEYEKAHKVNPVTGLLIETEEERAEHSRVSLHLLQIVQQNHENYQKSGGEAKPREEEESIPLMEDLPF